MHVDGASGAMVAPFLDTELCWDFKVPRVQARPSTPLVTSSGSSIRASGGSLARPRHGPARRARIQGQFSRGQRCQTFAPQLLPAGGPGGGAVLQLPAARCRRVPRRPGGVPGNGSVARRRDRPARAVHAHVPSRKGSLYLPSASRTTSPIASTTSPRRCGPRLARSRLQPPAGARGRVGAAGRGP